MVFHAPLSNECVLNLRNEDVFMLYSFYSAIYRILTLETVIFI